MRASRRRSPAFSCYGEMTGSVDDCVEARANAHASYGFYFRRDGILTKRNSLPVVLVKI